MHGFPLNRWGAFRVLGQFFNPCPSEALNFSTELGPIRVRGRSIFWNIGESHMTFFTYGLRQFIEEHDRRMAPLRHAVEEQKKQLELFQRFLALDELKLRLRKLRLPKL